MTLEAGTVWVEASFKSLVCTYYLLQIGFTNSESDVNLYYNVIGGEPLILVLYVDDLFITGAKRLIEGCKRDLASEFDMKDIGLMHYFWGLELWQEEGHIFPG